ncbi:ATP-dependent dethiobiotin synthetase BioD [Kutzneria sp. CA-103260]|nr:ATP-dependent dethiobiotin synthetase BioD [Kutzneria sp. CA-103260]
MLVAKLTAERLGRLKVSYVVRRTDLSGVTGLLPGHRPSAGDIVLARVELVGQHKALEQPDGRRNTLYPGDEVLVAYGHRYAPDQFEAVVPEDLGNCHLAAAGGLAARVLTRHAAIGEPTCLEPLGLLAGPAGGVVNLRAQALAPLPEASRRPPTLAVVGTSMNAGKTTTAAALIHGLTRAGLAVGAAKVTGTGAGGDVWQMHDSGAIRALDFTDAGYPSTCGLNTGELLDVVTLLRGHLLAAGAEAIVFEVADGVLQRETSLLLNSPEFVCGLDGVLFAAGDAMGAVAGVRMLHEIGVPMLAVTGRLMASPLAAREAAAHLGLPTRSVSELADPAVATKLIAELPITAAA